MPAQHDDLTPIGPGRLPEPAFDREAFLELRDLVWAVPVPRNVAAYAVRLCGASRPGDGRSAAFIKDYVSWGAGPRGVLTRLRRVRMPPLDGWLRSARHSPPRRPRP